MGNKQDVLTLLTDKNFCFLKPDFKTGCDDDDMSKLALGKSLQELVQFFTTLTWPRNWER